MVSRMAYGKLLGSLIIVISTIILVIYTYALFLTNYDLILIKLTLEILVAGISIVLIWIGYTILTAPPPKPIEEIEKEIEEELKKQGTVATSG